ncbi:MAG: NOB1 family endonuclease [Oscillospiraceae bacterium]|nr:NOB1 family endonuclease [Oscillospiraceae bacterium]
MKMKCPTCEHVLDDLTKKFCPKCGEFLRRVDSSLNTLQENNNYMYAVKKAYYKTPKKTRLVAAGYAIGLIVVLIIFNVINTAIANRPENIYALAVEQFQSGQYHAAMETALRLPNDYNDAFLLKDYLSAYSNFNRSGENLILAADIFEKLSGYRNSQLMFLESLHKYAIAEYNRAGARYLVGFDNAEAALKRLGDYKNSTEIAGRIPTERIAAQNEAARATEEAAERQRIAAEEAEQAAEEAERERVAEESRKEIEALKLDGTYVSYDGIITQTIRFNGEKMTYSFLGINTTGSFTINDGTLAFSYMDVLGNRHVDSYRFKKDGNSIFLDQTEFIKE